MGIAHRRMRWVHRATIIGLWTAASAAGGLGCVWADDSSAEAGGPLAAPWTAVESDASDEPADNATVPAARAGAFEFGLDAIALMKRERSEFRRVPRMLPLVAARTPHGQVWFGLARNRGESRAPGQLRAELHWTIPIGR